MEAGRRGEKRRGEERERVCVGERREKHMCARMQVRVCESVGCYQNIARVCHSQAQTSGIAVELCKTPQSASLHKKTVNTSRLSGMLHVHM